MMRTLCWTLTALLMLFAAVQYNDPDGLIWGAAYGAAAVWTAAAAARPAALRGPLARGLLGASLAAAACAAILLWPATPHWWRREVWWTVEEAREGMGLMILFGALLVPASLAFHPGRTRDGR